VIALDPDETAEIVLKLPWRKPAGERPTFIAHFMTSRELSRYLKLIEQARAIPREEMEKEDPLLVEAFRLALVGWRNVVDRDRKDVAFTAIDVGRLPELLTYRQKWALANAIPDELDLAEKEKKASDSSPPDAGGSSAGPASVAPVPQTTSPASSSPS
jgi:hypothetical protein